MDLIGFAALLLAGPALLGLALLGVRHLVRGAGRLRVDALRRVPPVADPEFPCLLRRFTSAELRGNRVELLLNGEGTLPRLWDDLGAAGRSIELLTYYARPGRMADELAAILTERARAGVEVRVLLDAIGSKGLPDGFLEALRRAGVRAHRLRPLRWRALDRLGNRAHARIVAVDGRVGYTGGWGLADCWYGDGAHPGQWRDTNVRVRGPAVARMRGAFAELWLERTGELLADAPGPGGGAAPVDGPAADFLFTRPGPGTTVAERFLALSVAGARERLYLTSGYFVPDDELAALLGDAARRGVDVRVLTASERTDVPLARWAGRARYERLLRAGVRIWEYRPAMMHAKSFVVDGRWCAVGAMNFDPRSMALNDESNLVALDAGLGGRMEEVFRCDLRRAREIRPDEFARRPLRERLLERGAASVARLA